MDRPQVNPNAITCFGYFYGVVYHIIEEVGITPCGLDVASNGFVKTWQQLQAIPKYARPRRCRRCWRGAR